MATFNDYLNKIATNAYQTVAKIELLRREDETIKQTIISDIISGNITINNKNGVRRTCNILLNNDSGTYIPNEYNLWINDKFKLSIGVLCDDGDYYYVKMGTFVFLNPVLNVGMGANTISISGVDKYSLLNGSNGGVLSGTYIIPLATNITTVISDILYEFNEIQPPIIHSSFSSETTPYTITEAYGNAGSDLLKQVQGMLSANVFYNVDGKYSFQPDFNDSTKGSQWDFNKTDFHYKNSSQEYLYQDVYNKVLVIGDNINGAIYDATATNNNLQSPTRIQLIGEKLKIIEDSNIYSTALAELRAKYELKRLTALYSTVSIKSAVIFHLDVDKVITLTDIDLNLDKERFLVQSINIPLGNNATEMTVGAVKTSDLELG